MRIAAPSLITPELAEYIENLSPAHVTRRHNFYDDFNRNAEDPEIWVSGGDAGELIIGDMSGKPTYWMLMTGMAVDNDRYLHGGGLLGNKRFCVEEIDYSTVTWKLGMWFDPANDMSAYMGLVKSIGTDYNEPTTDSILFFVDTAISNTFRTRSWTGAGPDEENDTGIVVDTDMHELKFVWTVADIKFYIDDVLVATHTVRVPNRPMFIEFLVRTEVINDPKRLNLDYIQVEVS